uniref:Uncharacterized protein n=1 Tax=Anguilla anguilla TaxID=7936 RepID=A0A0E9VUU7_ANGAN
MLCCVVLFAKACHKDALQRAEGKWGRNQAWTSKKQASKVKTPSEEKNLLYGSPCQGTALVCEWAPWLRVNSDYASANFGW